MAYSLSFPIAALEEYENLANRWIADHYGPAPSQPTSEQARSTQPHQGSFTVAKPTRPRLDIVETKDALVVTIELPGVKKEDISIDLHNGRLSISGELKSSQEHAEGNVWVSERRFGSFARTLTVPKGAKPEQVKAAFEDGVLRVEVPKATPEDQAAKRIPIV